MEDVMKKIFAVVAVAVLGFTLAGCPKKPNVKDNAGANSTVPANGNGASSGANAGNGPQTGPATPFGDSSGNGANGASAASAALSGKIVYFDYDKIEIKPEYQGIVTDAAHVLVAHPTWKVRLEGNTDERGTREYNIGLGERRAQAVRRAMMLQGASDSQITTVSYGEERPAVEGQDEAAFAKNRRVEMVALP
jgi:peptidoglycan-associated lipoprotein